MTPRATGNPVPQQFPNGSPVLGESGSPALVGCLSDALHDVECPRTAGAAAMGITKARLTDALKGERPCDLWRVQKLPLDVLRLWVMKMYRALGMPEPADVLIETGRALKQGRLSLLGTVPRPPPVKAQLSPERRKAGAAGTVTGPKRKRKVS